MHATQELYKRGNIVQWNSFKSAQVYLGTEQPPKYMPVQSVVYFIYSKTGRNIS